MPDCNRDIPVYQLLIDWDNDGGINAGQFEVDLGGWSGGGSGPPTEISLSTARSYIGSGSMLISWKTGTSTPRAQIDWSWTVGKEYTLSAWVYVPTGSPDIRWYVKHLTAYGTATAVNDEWVEMTYTFTATGTGGSDDVQIRPSGASATGDYAYIDDVTITLTGEDLWSNLRWQSTTDTEYGRDQARAFSPIRVGTFNTTLDNSPELDGCNEIDIYGAYWPENTDSPLYGLVKPGREIRYRATFLGTPYNLFQGRLDTLRYFPYRYRSELNIVANDILAYIESQSISTQLYTGLTSGDAINAVLDNIPYFGESSWPDSLRDIDTGSLWIPWFWAEGDNALNILMDIVNSEGPPAFLSADKFGRIIFRDRHHRIRHERSVTVQSIYKNGDTDNTFSWPLEYNHGWRDIINSVNYTIETRRPISYGIIFDSQDTIYSIDSGDTKVISIAGGDPFYNLVTPILDEDYTVLSGSVNVSLLRTSGISSAILVTAVAGAAQITNLRVRGIPLPVINTTIISDEDSTSISEYGKKNDEISRPWLNVNDAVAVSEVVLGMRAERLPTLNVTLQGLTNTVFYNQLNSQLSDRIRVTDDNSQIDFECFVEQINQAVQNTTEGRHTTTLGVEKVPDTVLDEPDTVFILSESSAITTGQPIFICENETYWQSSRSSRHLHLITQPDDVIVVIGQTQDSSTTLNTPTGNGISWTLRQSDISGGRPAMYLWTGTDSSGGVNWSLTVSRSAGYDDWGFTAYVFRNSDGVGASSKATSDGAPSLNITTTVNNSAISVLSSDYYALSGWGSRIWRTVNGYTPTQANKYERTYDRDKYGTTIYGAYYPNVGSSGMKTVGLSAPTGQHYTIMAVEIKSLASTQNPNPGGYPSLLNTALLGR